MELGYFGDTFGRPADIPLPWTDPHADPHVDMAATAAESAAWVVDLYRRAWAHADATIDALDIDSPGSVAHWPAERREVTLHLILVHVTTETHRHAGHADIVRELVDGAVGLRADNPNLPEETADAWARRHDDLENLARRFAP